MPDKPIGYGNPPKHSQYKKGQSGNPKGRPPKVPLISVLEAVLDEEVLVSIGGEQVQLSLKMVWLKKMANDAAKGDHKANQHLIKILKCIPEFYVHL